MKTENLLIYGAIAVGAYWIYETYFATPASTTPSVTPAVTPTVTPSGNPATVYIANPANPGGALIPFTPPPVNYNGQSLAAIYSRMAQGVMGVATGVQYTADQWNTFMSQSSTITPPDPSLVWTFTSAFPRSTTMTLAQYWSAMEPYLASQGMSGLGLVRGMGAFYRPRRNQ